MRASLLEAIRGPDRVVVGQTEADPGSILCGFRTYALAKDRVRAERRDPPSLGGSRPVEARRILGLVDSPIG